MKYTVILEKRETLRFTDGLIDQIVHRLYGLAEEEILIVETQADLGGDLT